MSGRKGAICEDRWLVNNYDSSFCTVVEKYLKCTVERVRVETVMLLTEVKERSVMEEIRKMRIYDKEAVSMACLGYVNTLEDRDRLIPDLFDIMEHKRGQEFTKAAMKMRSSGRSEDIPRLRRIYGQVDGDMRADVKLALSSIVDRDEKLKSKKNLILSVPVYPNEDAFERFLDKSIDYLDVRYRDNILTKQSISKESFNNIARALTVMRIRLYNEAENLSLYGPDKEDRYDELIDLLSWANSDLRKKTVRAGDTGKEHRCPRCGESMVSYKGLWSCPECGHTS